MAGLMLEAPRIVGTIERLKNRIDARFPGSGLALVCGELLVTSRAAARRAAEFGRPIIAIRSLTWLLVALLVTAVGLAITVTGLRWSRLELSEIIQTSEAGLSEAVLIGAGLVFLVGWERRLKRTLALRAIHELRSVAHVIDMHQLTKDPERLLDRYSSTSASPHETMTAFELNRYLDYCSELLSLTSKVAAVYVQQFDDPVVLEAVAEIEDLTTGLCQKIWQKVNLLQRFDDVRPSTATTEARTTAAEVHAAPPQPTPAPEP